MAPANLTALCCLVCAGALPWRLSQWTRNCPEAKFCWEARPALYSADAMEDLVGGDWNDDYWGESGGFIYGCARTA